MLLLEPIEIRSIGPGQVGLRCETAFDGVEFIFTRRENRLEHEDTFFFVTVGDSMGNQFAWVSVACFDRALNLFENLPDKETSLRPISLQILRDSPNQYRVAFETKQGATEKIFTIAMLDQECKVNIEEHTWTAELRGIWWHLSGPTNELENLVKAIVYLHSARNLDYTEEALKQRREPVPWKAYFEQQELNLARYAEKENQHRQEGSAP